jgi:hypothetical protein
MAAVFALVDLLEFLNVKDYWFALCNPLAREESAGPPRSNKPFAWY